MYFNWKKKYYDRTYGLHLDKERAGRKTPFLCPFPSALIIHELSGLYNGDIHVHSNYFWSMTMEFYIENPSEYRVKKSSPVFLTVISGGFQD